MDFLQAKRLTFMKDPKLEEEIALVKRCMETLRRFHSIFDAALSTETVVPEDEGRIQQLRQALPGEWEAVFNRLKLRRDDSVQSVVEMANSLPAVVSMTHYQSRKLYDLWHKAYMRLHFLLGSLEYRRESLADLRPGKLKAKKFLTSPVFVIILAMIALVLYIILQ
jgi:hypothetical protein